MVFEPPRDIFVDVPKISVAEWLLRQFRKNAAEGKTALIWADEGSEISYEEWLRDAVRLATAFRRMGVKSGDSLAVVAMNSPQLFPFILGSVLADIIISGNNFLLSPGELRDNFLITKPRYVLAPPEKVEAVREAISTITPRPEIIKLDEKTLKEFLSKGIDATPDTFKTTPVDEPEKHVFLYAFTSGTTGRQKAVMINDYHYLKNFVSVIAPEFANEGLMLCASQISWISWMKLMSRCALGRPWLYITTKTVELLLDHIHNYKPPWYFSTPYDVCDMSKAMEKHPGRWDISSLKRILVCGDRMSTDVHRQISQKLNMKIYQLYGATEFGIMSYAEEGDIPVYGSSGKCWMPVRLVNPETGEEITETNTIGEILCKKLQMTGYLGNPQASAEALDKDGWFKLGDVAYFDDNKNLFVVNRIKDMLRYNGFQVAPAELEEILTQIPGVSDAVVAGKNVDAVGSIITAFIVKKPDSNVTEQEIHDFLAKKNMHDAKKLRGGVIFVDKLPANANGKILRRELTDILNNPK